MLRFTVALHFCIIDITISAREPQLILSALGAVAVDQYILHSFSLVRSVPPSHDQWRYRCWPAGI